MLIGRHVSRLRYPRNNFFTTRPDIPQTITFSSSTNRSAGSERGDRKVLSYSYKSRAVCKVNSGIDSERYGMKDVEIKGSATVRMYESDSRRILVSREVGEKYRCAFETRDLGRVYRLIDVITRNEHASGEDVELEIFAILNFSIISYIVRYSISVMSFLSLISTYSPLG